MAPGLTSPGGRLPDSSYTGEDKEKWGTEEIEAGQVVVVEAEGKENACLVGMLRMGTAEMKTKKKGVVMDEGHYLGDGLWKVNLD